jgi:hypothetical protein
MANISNNNNKIVNPVSLLQTLEQVEQLNREVEFVHNFVQERFDTIYEAAYQGKPEAAKDLTQLVQFLVDLSDSLPLCAQEDKIYLLGARFGLLDMAAEIVKVSEPVFEDPESLKTLQESIDTHREDVIKAASSL